MIKIWKLFLSSILISGFTISVTKTFDSLVSDQYFINQAKPVYKNVKQNFSNYKADVKKALAGSNGKHTSNQGIIFNWKQYADSWNEFKANYRGLDLLVNMNIAFNWYNIKWNGTSLHVPLNNITVSSASNWVKIYQIDQKTTQWARNDKTHGKLSYACWIEGENVLIRFQLEAWASNNYDNYYYNIDTRSVTSNSTFDYNSIKSLFNEKVNNKTLVLDSDYSTSLQDQRNIAIEKIALDNLIEGALGQYYFAWKPYIAPYAYSDATNQVSITVKFTDPNNSQNIIWNFQVGIKFNLSQDYWTKTFKERLTITPGKIIDPNDPNGNMVTDEPLKWNDKDVYGTTAFIRFDGAPDSSETMKVNGTLVQVIDNHFTYQMTDNQDHETNEYDILLEKHDLKDFNVIIGSYQIKYLIKQDIPNLDLKWYAWNPDKNSDQKKLIEPTLPNGDINPDYDREVNPTTGTKTQIMWVKSKAQNPFPLDPLDKNGDIILDKNYDEGFLAEGSVSGMGITQNFSDSWIKSIQRVEVDAKTLNPIGSLEIVEPDSDGSYFSKSGTYLYIITDQKGITANKFVIIGQKWQNKYAKFLDILDDSTTAVSFWSTTQGFHLKNYLVKYKQLNSKNIQELSFAQVSSYWKEYVSDVRSQHIEPGVDPGNNLDLSTINLNVIKMNSNESTIIRSNIINSVTKELNKYQLESNVDYRIEDLEANVTKLLDFDSSGNAIVTLTIKAEDTSIKARNYTTIIVRNSIDYDSNKVTDLSKIAFDSYQYNFSNFTSHQLREWILKAIDKKFQSLNIDLVYQIDYDVSSLDDDILNQFIIAKELTKLEIIIKAELLSNLAINSTSLVIINDPNGETAPPDPPDPKPDPDPTPLPKDDDWITKKENLIIMTFVVLALVGSIGIIIFFKYRFKKGIGGKKNKKNHLKINS